MIPRILQPVAVSTIRENVAVLGERVLVLAIDRWHPVAKIAEAAGRPDLLEAAIAINGAASTATYVLHYGPIGVTEGTSGECRLHSLGQQDLAPWPMLRDLTKRAAVEQEQAVRYLAGRTRNVYQVRVGVSADLEALGDRWEGFEHMMRLFQRRMHMPDSERVRNVDPTVPSLLAMVATEVYRALRADFLNKFATIVLNDPKIISHVMHDSRASPNSQCYKVQVDGRETVLEIHAPLVTAMLDSLYVTAPEPATLKEQGIRIAVGAKTLLTVGITATPEFAIKNALRDMLAAFVLGRVWQAPWHMLESAADEVRGSDLSRDWLLHGGSFSAFYEHSTEFDSEKPETILAAVDKGWKRGLRRVWRIYTSPMRGLEAGSRIAQFRRLLNRGATPRQAMMHSRQISTDFADRGSSQIWWTYCRTVPFLNAALQGMNQIRKVFFTRGGLGGRTRGPVNVYRHSPHARGSFARAIMLMAIPCLALMWNSSSDSRQMQYEDQAAFEKANYVYFYDVNGSDYRIPVPFELGAVFMKGPELVLDRLLRYKTVDTDRAVDPFPMPTMRALAESTFLLSFIPALVQPTWHVLSNHDFLGREIEPGYMRNWPSADRYYSSTPILARVTGAMLPGISPLQIKVLLEGHFGHMVRLMMYGTNEMVWSREKHGEVPFPQFWYRATGKRAFVAQGPRRYTRHTIDLRELGYEAEAARWKCRNSRHACAENRELIAIGGLLRSYATIRRTALRHVRVLEREPGVSREDKEERIAEVYESLNEGARTAREAIDHIRSR